jgi:hypothetical protein
MSDVNNILQGFGVQLESKALGQFGAAVGDYARQAGLGPLADIAQTSINNKGLTTTSIAGLASAFGVNNIDNILGTMQQILWRTPQNIALYSKLNSFSMSHIQHRSIVSLCILLKKLISQKLISNTKTSICTISKLRF